MGRKGTNKGKPKATSRPGSKAGSITELVKDKGAPVSKGNASSSTGSNKTQNKH
jgi:hypothetical protein